MRAIPSVIVIAVSGACLFGYPVQQTIDDPQRVVLVLNNGRQAFGQVTAVTERGIQFRIAASGVTTLQPWGLVVVARTDRADYLPGENVGTLDRRDVNRKLKPNVPRIIGPHEAVVTLANRTTMTGTAISVLGDDVGFQAVGQTVATTIPARSIESIKVLGETYVWNTTEQSLTKSLPKWDRPPKPETNEPDRPEKPVEPDTPVEPTPPKDNVQTIIVKITTIIRGFATNIFALVIGIVVLVVFRHFFQWSLKLIVACVICMFVFSFFGNLIAAVCCGGGNSNVGVVLGIVLGLYVGLKIVGGK
jgi:hypothetical protein